ncbi:deoxyribose-phosphate aldolase [Sulfuriroseicoccus oceanibius]|uniref:Deoxyribose-phosphate aldolase n=1 Tax=Sulfuriroseicoccus oceanibius TaxID=2707525 RepID=A0A6B3LDF7_9BACT|nr:deoxyribose-phosphate aldolase [Sulfuriroseicoccus oceanibius]QQL44950.1 deoxyribose-phosphate aldolase [Sulfuriroseicoccus oceanibius]
MKTDHTKLLQLITLLDLTTLTAVDNEDDVAMLCQRAVEPLGYDHGLENPPSCAAVCVWPVFAGLAADITEGTSVGVACVAGGFPFAQTPLTSKISEIHYAVDEGASEIDVAINRGAFLAGELEEVHDEIAAMKDACSGAHLKVILETCDLPHEDAVRQAAQIALQAGADFLKTSTGMGRAGATMADVGVLLEEAVAWEAATGRAVGVKAAGGIKSAYDALDYVELANSLHGPVSPVNFRIGASSLLDDVLAQLAGS